MTTASIQPYPQNYDIALSDETGLSQDKEYFYVNIKGKRQKILLHDYKTIYQYPMLYETLIYDLLGCQSPALITEKLKNLQQEGILPTDSLKILEIGAGSGVFGQSLRKTLKPTLLCGLDLLLEAKKAAKRDRPTCYDQYYIADLTKLNIDQISMFQAKNFNLIGAVAASGYGHLPVEGYEVALDLLAKDGFLLFHVRPDENEASNMALIQWIKDQETAGLLNIIVNEMVFHRKSTKGKDIKYLVVIGQKCY